MQLYIAALNELGLDNVGTIVGDTSVDPTLASSAAQVVATGANGVILVEPNNELAITALASAGYKGKESTIAAPVSPAFIAALGPLANGLLVSSQSLFVSNTNNAAVKKFLADMKKYEPSSSVDTNSLSAYASVELFARVLETSKAKKLNNKAFIVAANHISKPINIGLIGPWSIEGRKPALAAFPRVLNPTISFGVVSDDVLRPSGPGFSNPFAP